MFRQLEKLRPQSANSAEDLFPFFCDLFRTINIHIGLIFQVSLFFGALTSVLAVPASMTPPALRQERLENQSASSESSGQPDAAARLYADKCSACHTVGGGDLVGPDLLSSTEWAADELTKGVKRMEEMAGPLTDDEVRMLVELLKDPQVTARIEGDQQFSEQESAATDEPASAETGRQLFTGEVALENGGIACASCHRVGSRGGTLAVDLTDSFSRLGRSALLSGIEQAGYPVMRSAYASHPVTRPEALHLAAFLQEIQDSAGAPDSQFPVLWMAVAAALLFFGCTTLFYRNRNTGTRRRLVHKASGDQSV